MIGNCAKAVILDSDNNKLLSQFANHLLYTRYYHILLLIKYDSVMLIVLSVRCRFSYLKIFSNPLRWLFLFQF